MNILNKIKDCKYFISVCLLITLYLAIGWISNRASEFGNPIEILDPSSKYIKGIEEDKIMTAEVINKNRVGEHNQLEELKRVSGIEVGGGYSSEWYRGGKVAVIYYKGNLENDSAALYVEDEAGNKNFCKRGSTNKWTPWVIDARKMSGFRVVAKNITQIIDVPLEFTLPMEYNFLKDRLHYIQLFVAIPLVFFVFCILMLPGYLIIYYVERKFSIKFQCEILVQFILSNIILWITFIISFANYKMGGGYFSINYFNFFSLSVDS